MSYDLASLPKNLRGSAPVEKLVDSLRSSRAKNSELREIAKDAVSPGRATLDIQAGAFVHGAIEGIAGERYAPLAEWAAALALAGAGLVMEKPDLVLVANGLLAPMTSAKAYDLVTSARSRRRDDEDFPENK